MKLRFKLYILISLLIPPFNSAYAWEGYDSDTNSYITIGEGNLVKEGEIIQIYNHRTGSTESVFISNFLDDNMFVVYDSDNDTYRTFTMMDND